MQIYGEKQQWYPEIFQPNKKSLKIVKRDGTTIHLFLIMLVNVDCQLKKSNHNRCNVSVKHQVTTFIGSQTATTCVNQKQNLQKGQKCQWLRWQSWCVYRELASS